MAKHNLYVLFCSLSKLSLSLLICLSSRTVYSKVSPLQWIHSLPAHVHLIRHLVFHSQYLAQMQAHTESSDSRPPYKNPECNYSWTIMPNLQERWKATLLTSFLSLSFLSSLLKLQNMTSFHTVPTFFFSSQYTHSLIPSFFTKKKKKQSGVSSVVARIEW